jgi:hypothetical protein
MLWIRLTFITFFHKIYLYYENNWKPRCVIIPTTYTSKLIFFGRGGVSLHILHVENVSDKATDLKTFTWCFTLCTVFFFDDEQFRENRQSSI